ncbi:MULTISPECIES: LytR C-terminal domain-containing protein [Streptomyces]|uniref:LytR C-terminal domain-containing protein n=1 Tax=Streptomyces TaxID=1883 RepID=UPI001E396B39|nr:MULTISPECIES: LytR C-terminal domain-containing protein [Streptomyces]UFQ16711.1 LytR C-terminal domain-containing protein [Streptomyces huasconensis]WCL86311.1 LytR C-terminal domain-containing protein [Streptomyces sp. JCM 35825]
MSMLTPPGMGGKYRITGDKYPRMRRTGGPRRLVLAIIASAAAMALIGWGTLQLIQVFTGGDKASAAAGTTQDCDHRTPEPGATPKPDHPRPHLRSLPKPAQITVNVFNATPRGGLAKKTADELKKRGFAIGEVGNATKQYDKKVKGTGILLGAKKTADTAFPVLGTQLAGTEHRTDGRTGGEVDLILGTRFKELAKKEDADKALAELAKPKPTPTPSAEKNC